jgi:TatD DNase family protein
MLLIDTHCHLDLVQFDEDLGEVLARAKAAGVGAIVIPAIDLGNVERVLGLAESSVRGESEASVALYAAVGVHPNSAATWTDETLEYLRRAATHPRAVAIGEIGLDNYWKDATPQQQEDALWQQLELAAQVGKPVIIHNREATAEVRSILRQWVQSIAFRASPLAHRPFAGVLHAFGGTAVEAEEAYEWGFAVSLGGPVTFRNAHNLHALAPQLRLDRLMLETDAPYLTPHPHRGKRNEPSFVALVCQQIAALRGITFDEVARATAQVANEFFMLEELIRVDNPNDPRRDDAGRHLAHFGARGASTS